MAAYDYTEWPYWEDCIICKNPQPQGRFHEYPWHITCDDDEAGKKKAAVWMREQKKLAKAAVPTLALPD
jgi:hypothetical protein